MNSYGTKKYTTHFGGYVAGKFLNRKMQGKLRLWDFWLKNFEVVLVVTVVDVRTSLGTLHLEMTFANDTTAIFAITSAQVNEDLEVPVFF